MTVTSAARSRRRPDLRRPCDLRRDILFYITVLLALSFLLGFVSSYLFFRLSGIILYLAALNGFFSWWDYSDGMVFIIERQPYDIGDLIEIDPSAESFSLDWEKSWRVVNFDLSHTKLHHLPSSALDSWPNGMLAKCRIKNWSRLPAKFQVVLRVPVDVSESRVALQDFHEKIKQYASDNPSEWFAVDTSIDDAITVEKEYSEYCIELRHRESWSWPAYQLVFDSKFELLKYCHMQAQRLNNTKSGKTNGSPPTAAVGNNNESGADDCDDNDCTEKDTRNTEEHDEGYGNKKEENNAKDDWRIDYRVFIR